MNSTENGLITIQNPWLLLVGVGLLIVVIVGFFLIPKQKRNRPKNIISLVLHCLMCVTLALAFADIRIQQTTRDTEVYVLADCSASEEENSEAMDTVIDQVISESTANAGVKVGVIGFAKEQKVITPMGGNFDSVSTLYEDESWDASATDLASAITYANDQFSDNVVRKIVIVSDGEETDNNAIDTIDKIVSDDSVVFDAVSVTGESTDETAITGLSYTDHCFTGRPESLKVSVRSRKLTSGTLTLTSEGTLIEEKQIDLSRGLNVITFDGLEKDEPGEYNYTVTLVSHSDSFDENNQMSFTQDFSSDLKVLFVSGAETTSAGEAQYSEFLTLSGYTEDQVTPVYNFSQLPYKLEDLNQYDQFVLSDVDLTEFAYVDQFVTNLNSLVSEAGKSLFTFGSTYAGAKTLEAYNDMLPIQFNSTESKAIALVIDTSGSMSGNNIKMAKQGARACLDLLNDNDYIAIISFSDKTTVLQSLTSIKNKSTIAAAINKLKASGGTTLAPAITAAYNQLSGVDTEYKNILIISDGEPSDTSKAIQYARKYSSTVTISTINVGDGASTMKKIAIAGGGTYYYCRNAASLVATMKSSVNSEIENKEIEASSEVTIADPEDPTVSGISSLPNINGFSYCRIKKVANTVLTVTYEKEGTDVLTSMVTIPLFAYWTYGNGTVSSFSSSLYRASGTDWTASFRSSDSGKTFLNAAINANKPERKSVSDLDLTYANNGMTTTLTVRVANEDQTAPMTAQVSYLGNDIGTYSLYSDGTHYTGEIPTTNIGGYTVKLTYTPSDGSDPLTLEARVYFNYSKEYDVFSDVDNTTLFDIIEEANLASLSDTKPNHYYQNEYSWQTNAEDLQYESRMSTMYLFVIITVVLFLIDVLVRKSDLRRHVDTKTKPNNEKAIRTEG